MADENKMRAGDARREAIFVLACWLETGDFPDRMIADGPARAFISDLVFTTIRRLRSLDFALDRFVARRPTGETRAALLIGAAQLLFMPTVKEHAALYETVEAAKRASRASAPFVNGVLRNILRNRASLLKAIAESPFDIRYSHPRPLVRRWIARYGAERAERLLARDNEVPQIWLAYPPAAHARFVALPRGAHVEEQPGFAEGGFIVQDPATAGAIELLDVRPGQKVLDACAAPGGKSIQIGWRLAGEGRLVAADLHEDRLVRVRANFARVRLGNVEVIRADAADLADPAWAGREGSFDRVLADVPCSNTGVLRRRVDARWRWSAARMEKLAATQARILENMARLLAPGGTLVYSTCSLEPEENERIVEKFLAAHADTFVAGEVRAVTPLETGSDGAFAAAIRRR